MTHQQWMIVGLGNPGRQYEKTRHNLGFMVVQAFASKHCWGFKADSRFSAVFAKGEMAQTTVHLLLPTTYMNLSGIAVKKYQDYFKVPLQHIVVVMDDVSLPFGQLRLRSAGTSGGHNGLRSVQEHLGTIHYARLKMGVGDHRKAGEATLSLADYVLSGFTQEESNHLEELIDRGVQALERLVKEPMVEVMNAVNTLPASKVPPKAK